MRTKKSIRNSISSAVCFLITTLIGFIAQKVFLKTLGTELLGLNGLYNNIISMLSITELGIGSAIICNLYKPVSNNDDERVKSLLNFYKKSYYIIALIIILLSVLILPFLNIIVGNISVDINIYFIFSLYVLDSVCSYFLSYKRSILYATQENYLINYIHLGYVIVLNAIQICILFITTNFVLFLLIRIIMRVLENVAITYTVNKKYSNLRQIKTKKLDEDTKKNIIEKIKGLFFHKIGAFVVMGTDNILISYLLGVVTVGLYYNYSIIIVAANNLITQFLTATTSSVGNLLVTENKEKMFITYKNMYFINYIFAIISSVLLLNLLQPFICLWIGKEYLLDMSIVIVLVINYYLTIMRRTISIFKEAAGIFYEDRFVPIIESIINIVTSIILGKIFGLSGIFMGTIISTLFLYIFDFPKYGYKLLFNKNKNEFIIDFIKRLLLTLLIIAFNILIMHFIIIDNYYAEILIKTIVTLVVNITIIICLFMKKSEFKYSIKLCKKIIKKNNFT